MTRDDVETLLKNDIDLDSKKAILQRLIHEARKKALEEALEFLYVDYLCPETFAKAFDKRFNLGKWP